MDFGELLDRSRNEIYIFDERTLKFLHVSRGAAENLGYSKAELLELTPLDIKPEITVAGFDEILAPLRSGAQERQLFATVHLRKDGTTYPVDIHLQLDSHDGRRVFLAVILDVTDRRSAEDRAKRLEAQLHQSQRLEAIGRLAGGVAHDFNNLLTVIITSASLLESSCPASSRPDLDAIVDAAERAASLTSQLLAFGRRQVLEPQLIVLNDVINGLRVMIERLVREHTDVEFALSPDLGAVRVDPIQVQQVVVNLVTNARDAMPRGGTLTITTANENGHGEDGSVCLAVTDTGIGMSEETLAHIFEPFFSTKPTDGGTGLGLATVHGIVSQSGGTVHVDSEVGVGTTIRVGFPRSSKAAIKPTEAVVSLQGGERPITILLAEDNEAVRVATLRLLKSRGYHLLHGDNGLAALDASRGYDGEIDLVLSDVVMPGMDGPSLARELRRERPGVRVLFVSGYVDGIIDGDKLQGLGEQFLQKPFTQKTLFAKIDSILNTTSAMKSSEG